MVVLDEDFGTGLTLVEGNGGVRLSPVSVPEHAPRDWRSQCERERARADAAEARAEELRWAEVAARSDGGSWKSRFKACRRRLSEAVEETKEARRTARDVPSLQAEVARLETLLSEAGIASAFDTAGALRKENARLRKALAASKAREGRDRAVARSAPAAHRPGAFPGPEGDRQVASHGTPPARQGGGPAGQGEVEGPARQASGGRGDAVEAAVRRGCPTACGPEAVAAPEDDDERAAQAKRPSAQDRAEVGDPESGAGGSACQASRDQEGTRVRACRASGGQEDVVEVAVRCRRRSPQGSAKVAAPEGYDQVAVPGEARLRKGAKTSRNRIETLEVQLERLRATGAVLSRALYGRKSEQQDKPGSEHKRGQQRGAPGHGRTSGPGSMSAPKSTTRRRMRASAAGAGSPMRRTAPRNPPSSRSRSRPTSA